MEMVQAGETEKLGILFERYKRILFAYFFRNTGDRDASEDLVQVVFFRILKYKKNFAGRAKFTTWLFSVAHNVRIDHYKKNKKYSYHEDVTDIEIEDFESVEQKIIKEEQSVLLKKALLRLKPDKRELIVLSKYQGLKYKEIGEMLGVSESNIKLRVFRALKDLKEIYNELEK